MAALVFGAGHFLKVQGGVEEAVGLLVRAEAAGDWAHVQSGTQLVRVNPRQVAYVADDSAFPVERPEPAAEPFV